MKGKPKEVIETPFGVYAYHWTVSKEQERFLMMVNTADIDEGTKEEGDATPEPTHLKVVYNWFTELNELVPLDEE